MRALKGHFKKANIVVDEFLDVTNDIQRTLKPWIAKGATVAAIGGDGTLSGIAGMLVDTKAVFAPLSGGTLNHFTKDLGISQDLDEALAAVAHARPHYIDVASVNGTVFINNSSIGLYPSSLHEREQLEGKRISKWPAAVIAMVRALARYRSYQVTIGDETFKTPFLFVGNNDYHLEDPTISGRTKLNEGLLSVYTIASASRWSLVKLLGHALVGQLAAVDEVKIWKTASLTIHTRKSQIRVSRDGEMEKVKTPLHYEIKAGKLRIIGS
jgi:diacylglycerol kinase family enzyme